MSKKIGFIGQGWVGKNYADNFEKRGFEVVRYSNEGSYKSNKVAIGTCDFVFVAVPTPTTTDGFDDSVVRKVVSIVGKGKTAVIKSTIPPGTTRSLQKNNPDIYIISNPEFLRESFVTHDIENPDRNIIGIPKDNSRYRKLAAELLRILPKSKYDLICDSDTSEFIKYSHNMVGFSLVVFSNILYDLSSAYNLDWDTIKEVLVRNPWIPGKYIDPIHKGGRGAGGSCFIKDFAAFKLLYKKLVNDHAGNKVLSAYERKNIELLLNSGKDTTFLKGVYGNRTIDAIKKRKKA